MKEYFLKPGEIVFSKEEARIVTILGSCIAVCVYDVKEKFGGMCHYYLPRPSEEKDISDSDKYGIFAIPNLLKFFKDNNSKKENLRAKVVGGGHVVDSIEKSNGKIGADNIKMAKETLLALGIKIEAEAVGGEYGKKIRFYTTNGNVEMKKIQKSSESLVGKKIKVMIVDDSKPMRTILKKMVEMNKEFEVIHLAEDAFKAQELIAIQRPDVITLDINMPKMNGVEFLKKLMLENPIPTIMVSALNFSESGPVFEALEIGAFDYIKKPDLSEIESLASELHEKISAAFNSHYIKKGAKKIAIKNSLTEQIAIKNVKSDDLIIAIGASTGGTQAISEVLDKLPSNIPPIVITQHIPPIFSAAFADRLNNICKFSVKEAKDGDQLLPGNAYVAPGGMQMRIENVAGKIIIKITDDPPVNRFKPSVDYLFESVSKIKHRKIMGIILTGMGGDGAQGMLMMKNKGAYTVGQDESSCVVYGMPKVAYELGAVKTVVPLERVPKEIAKFVNNEIS